LLSSLLETPLTHPHSLTRASTCHAARDARLEALKQLSDEQTKELASARGRISELSKVGAELGA
jgi:hypothetical protein